MFTLETEVVQWRSLYGELSEAQRQLRDAHANRSPFIAELENQVRSLQQQSDRALDAIDAALAARRASHQQH
jgi:hypothetical protein